MWNNLTNDEEFILIVRDIDNALYDAGLKYSEVIKMFNDEQADKWCERILNRDAEYKYIQSLNEGKRNNLGKLQGPRSSHRKWWLNKRFAIYDGKFISGDYKAYQISMKINQKATQSSDFAFSIVPTELMHYGWGITSRSQGENIQARNIGERIVFDPFESGVVEFIDGTPLEVYEVPYISEIDLSCFQVGLNLIDFSKASNPVLGSNLKRVILGTDFGTNDGERALEPNGFSSIETLSSLEYLDIRGYKKLSVVDLSQNTNIKEVLAQRSGLSQIMLPSGSKITRLELPETMTSLQLDGANYLTSSGLTFENNNLSNLINISILNCEKLSTYGFTFFNNWYRQRESVAGCQVNMQGIKWRITYEQFELLKEFSERGERLILKGEIEIQGNWSENREESLRRVNEIKSLFGEHCFEPNGRTDVFVTCQPFIILNASQFNMVGKLGNEIDFTCDVYPYYEGEQIITYSSNNIAEVSGITLENKNIGGQKIGVLKVAEELVYAESPFHLNVTATFQDIHYVNHTSTLTVDIVNPTYPRNIGLEGKTSVHSGETQAYTIKAYANNTEEATGTYSISYTLSGETQYVDSHSIDGNIVTINFNNQSPATYAILDLNITITSKVSVLEKTEHIKILNDNVIMTIDTNPVVFKALHDNGYVDDDAVLLREVAEGITSFGTALSGLRTAFTFDEIAEFTNLTTLETNAFSGSYITNITIPNHITTFGEGIFDGCSMLSAVTLPTCAEFTEIPSRMFRFCTNLSKVVIPDNVTKICRYAFGGNPLLYNLTTSQTATNAVVIGDNLTTIEDYSFEANPDSRETLGCVITSITITRNLLYSDISNPQKGIDQYLLLAHNLKEIIVDENNVKYESVDNVLYSSGRYVLYRYPSGKQLDVHEDGTYIVDENCHRIGEYAFFRAGRFSPSVDIADTYIGQLLTLKISNLTEDSAVNAIGNYAFEHSTIVTIDLSDNDSLRVLPFGAFENCRKLQNIIFPTGLYEIQRNAFNYCNSLTGLVIPDSVEYISDAAILNCENLETLVLPRNMRYSGTVCSACPKLRTVMLPCYHTGATEYSEGERTNLDEYYHYTIQCENLQEYQQYKRYIDGTLVEEDDGRVYFVYDGVIYKWNNQGQASIYRIPNGRSDIDVFGETVSINDYCFSNTKLSAITLPNTVKYIGTNAFAYTKLEEITIPGSVKSLGTNAFMGCSNLSSVTIEEGTKEIGSSCFMNCTSLKSLILPETMQSFG